MARRPILMRGREVMPGGRRVRRQPPRAAAAGPQFVLDPTGRPITRQESRQQQRAAVRAARQDGGRRAARQTRRQWRQARRGQLPTGVLPEGPETLAPYDPGAGPGDGGLPPITVNYYGEGQGGGPAYPPGSFAPARDPMQVTDRTRVDLANQITNLV